MHPIGATSSKSQEMIKESNSLIKAALGGDVSTVLSLLASGAEVNAIDKDGRTALMHATLNEDMTLVGELLKAGADPNVADNVSGQTAMHYAAQKYAVGITKALIKARATIDVQDDFGNTPLWRAVFESRGRGEMIKLLLANGAERDLKNKSGVSPFELAETIANYNAKQYFEDAE